MKNVDADPCNNFAWSNIYIFLFCVSFLVMGLHLFTIWRRRQGENAVIGCFDVLSMALFAATVIQFGPMLSQVNSFVLSGRIAATKTLALLRRDFEANRTLLEGAKSAHVEFVGSPRGKPFS